MRELFPHKNLPIFPPTLNAELGDGKFDNNSPVIGFLAKFQQIFCGSAANEALSKGMSKAEGRKYLLKEFGKLNKEVWGDQTKKVPPENLKTEGDYIKNYPPPVI